MNTGAWRKGILFTILSAAFVLGRFGDVTPIASASLGQSNSSSGAQCFEAGIEESFETRSLGPGSKSFPITASGMIDDTHYVVSRHMSLTPGIIAGVNVDDGEMTYQDEVVIDDESSEGTWGATASGDDLYVGMSFTGDKRSSILRLDHETQELDEVASTAPADLIWDMATAPDGTIYASTSRQNGAGLWEYDPEQEDVEFIDQFEHTSRQDARSVAATEDTVFIGLGNAEPDLIAYDRDSGDSESVLPEELEDTSYVYTLEASEDYVAAGTSSPSMLTVMDPEDPDDYETVDVPSGTVQSIEIVDDMVYFTGGSTLWSYDIDDNDLEELTEVDINSGQTRGLFYRDGVLHGSGNLGQLWSYDLEDEDFEFLDTFEAVDEGAQGSPLFGEPAQSLAAANGKVYAGGHVTVGARDSSDGQLSQIDVPGEPKGMEVVDGNLYMALYSNGNLVRYDLETEELETLARAPDGHNRPRDLDYDLESQRLFMTVQADTEGGGSLVVYDIEEDESETYEPFDDQAVSAVAASEDTAYVAGSAGMQDPGEAPMIVAVDQENGDHLWEVDLNEDASTVTGLELLDGVLFAITSKGTVLAVNVEIQEIDKLGGDFGPGDLIEHRGEIYGATEDELFVVERDDVDTRVILDDLNGEWFTWPSLASDGCSLFVMDGAEVMQIGEETASEEPSTPPEQTEPEGPEEPRDSSEFPVVLVSVVGIVVIIVAIIVYYLLRKRRGSK